MFPLSLTSSSLNSPFSHCYSFHNPDSASSTKVSQPPSKGDLFRKVQGGKTRGPHLSLSLSLSLSHTHTLSILLLLLLCCFVFLITFTNKCRHGILGCCKVSVFWFRYLSPNHLYSCLLLLT